MSDRRAGIGASELPAIAGLAPWATPVSVWLEKVGLGNPPGPSQGMRAGQRLEVPILRLAAEELDAQIIHNTQRFRHPDWPRPPLWATPDGFTRHREGLVEVKLVAHRWSDWQEGPPPYVRLQVQAQLACLPRARRGYVAALVGGDLRTYTIERDPEVQAAIPGLVNDWWGAHVIGGIAPEPTDPDDEWALLRARLDLSSARLERLAADDERAIAGELLVLLQHSDALGEQIDQRRRRLAELAGDANLSGPGWTARWQQRSSVSWRELADRLQLPPAVIEEYTRQSSSFVFRRSGRGEENGRGI